MPEATLLKLVEEILERKFEQDEKKPQHAAIKTANQSTNSLNSISMLMNQQQQIDILTFAYYHFLSLQGLKSLSIRYLNSLYSGLKKIYLRNTNSNLYA